LFIIDIHSGKNAITSLDFQGHLPCND